MQYVFNSVRKHVEMFDNRNLKIMNRRRRQNYEIHENILNSFS